MDATLQTVKAELRRHYLGKHGIHGIGVKELERSICVYVDPDSDLDGSAALETIRQAAAPYSIVLIREEKPRAS
jgi:hypothetical protein